MEKRYVLITGQIEAYNFDEGPSRAANEVVQFLLLVFSFQLFPRLFCYSLLATVVLLFLLCFTIMMLLLIVMLFVCLLVFYLQMLNCSIYFCKTIYADFQF